MNPVNMQARRVFADAKRYLKSPHGRIPRFGDLWDDRVQDWSYSFTQVRSPATIERPWYRKLAL